MSNKYVTLTDVEVESIEVRVEISDILSAATDAQLVEALRAGDYDGAEFLENADVDALWEALKDKEPSDLIDVLEEANELEQAARRFFAAMETEDDCMQFLLDDVLPKGVHERLVHDVTRVPEIVFQADSPGAPVHWVQDVSDKGPCGMILPDLSNIAEGRAKLLMFVNTPDDTGWIDCATLDAAQRLARFLHAGRAVMEQRKGSGGDAPVVAQAPVAEASQG